MYPPTVGSVVVPFISPNDGLEAVTNPSRLIVSFSYFFFSIFQPASALNVWSSPSLGDQFR